MQRERGSWTPSTSTLSKANAVLNATAASGNLYRNGLGMIASENIVSPMVQKIVASDLHGRYAEGLPGKRYYQGCNDFDTIESMGIELAQSVFNAPFANIQSTSGTVSNIAALKALASRATILLRYQLQMAAIYLTLEWVQSDFETLICRPTHGMKNGWNRTLMEPVLSYVR